MNVELLTRRVPVLYRKRMTGSAFFAKRLIGLRLPGRPGPSFCLSRIVRLIVPLVVVIASLWKVTAASEFPERECCDDLVPSVEDGGLDLVKTPGMAGNHGGGTTPSSLSSFSTETPPHSSEHPDTSNFLYPEFIPELSLDLGYPLPPPPPPFRPHHQHPPDGANDVLTTTGTGIHVYAYIDPSVQRTVKQVKKRKEKNFRPTKLTPKRDWKCVLDLLRAKSCVRERFYSLYSSRSGPSI